MTMFGGMGIRKARCQQRVCIRNSPKNLRKDSFTLPTKSKSDSKEVVKAGQSTSKQVKTEKVGKTVESKSNVTEAKISVSGTKGLKKTLPYLSTPQRSPKIKAESSVKAQTSPMVQTLDIGDKGTDIKPTRNSPRLKPAVQSAVVPAATPAPDVTTDKPETAAPCKSSEDTSNSTPTKVCISCYCLY
jgi:hypothetical protein